MFKMKTSGVGSAALVLLSACVGVTDGPTEVDSKSEEIIGGVAANGARLNAIGSLGLVFTDWQGTQVFEPFCSGALIGQQTVLSAKHCTDLFFDAALYGYSVAFGVGPNGFAPTRILDVVDVQRAPGDVGGYVGYGHDVGVFHLLDPVTDIAPLQVSTLSDADVGSKLVAIGYGVQDNAYNFGTRRTGNVTLRALRGRIYEIVFESFEGFVEWFNGNPVFPPRGAPGGTVAMRTPELLVQAKAAGAQPADHDGAGGAGEGGGTAGSAGAAGKGGAGGNAGMGGFGNEGGDGGEHDFLRSLYDTTVLDEGYEVFVGGVAGDAQPCYGDSGGPLLRRNAAGELVAYGVASGVVVSREQACDFGAVYATFGPGVLEFVEQSRSWVDPCLGLSSSGVCEGDVAHRCTSPLEGPRRPVQFDCSMLGETCAVQANGAVGCGSDIEE